jgi:hypothetical protein
MAKPDRGRWRSTLALTLALVALALPASAETWKNVMLLDVMCSKLDRVMKDAQQHPRACILECHDDGYGVVLRDGDFLRFDDKGSRLALDILRSDDAPEQNVRVNVSGKLKGGVIHVDRIGLSR